MYHTLHTGTLLLIIHFVCCSALPVCDVCERLPDHTIHHRVIHAGSVLPLPLPAASNDGAGTGAAGCKPRGRNDKASILRLLCSRSRASRCSSWSSSLALFCLTFSRRAASATWASKSFGANGSYSAPSLYTVKVSSIDARSITMALEGSSKTALLRLLLGLLL